MSKKQDSFFERGASLLEVILSITLVLLLVPFLYGQITDMNDTVKNVIMARKIVNMQDGIKNYILLKNAEFEEGENVPFNEEDLSDIAPGAVRGIIRKTSNGVVSIEAFLEFNIDDSKYKAADVAKYIGDDAAIVQSNNVAYSEYWAAQLAEPDNFEPGNLVYRVSYSFGAGDESNYLHKTDYNGFNVMERNLYMNNNGLTNVNSINADLFTAKNAQITALASSGCTTINVGASNDTLFERKISIDSDVSFNSLRGGLGKYIDICYFNNINFGILDAENNGMFVSSSAKVINSSSESGGILTADKLALLGDGERSTSFNTVSLSNAVLSIASKDASNKNYLITTSILQPIGADGNYAPLFITNDVWSVGVVLNDFTGESSGKPLIKGKDPYTILGSEPFNVSRIYTKIGV